MYCSIPEGMSPSTKFDTYIIAFCPDSDDWFITNNRFFYYEYPKEFQTKEEAFEYFKDNFKEFYYLEKDLLGEEWNHLPTDFQSSVSLDVSDEKEAKHFDKLIHSKYWQFYLIGTIDLIERWRA